MEWCPPTDGGEAHTQALLPFLNLADRMFCVFVERNHMSQQHLPLEVIPQVTDFFPGVGSPPRGWIVRKRHPRRLFYFKEGNTLVPEKDKLKNVGEICDPSRPHRFATVRPGDYRYKNGSVEKCITIAEPCPAPRSKDSEGAFHVFFRGEGKKSSQKG